MKKIFTLICGFVLSYIANAQMQTTQAAGGDAKNTQSVTTTPAVDVISLKEVQYDFGKIPQGKPVTHVFMFTNTGKTPLVLDNVQASCGCTTPEWSKDPVAAGETSKITVGYNAASEGPFTKFITVSYNGSQSKQVIIKGEVWKTPVTSAPENSALGNLKNQQ